MGGKSLSGEAGFFCHLFIKIDMNRSLYLFAVVVVSFLPSIAKASGNPILPTVRLSA